MAKGFYCEFKRPSLEEFKQVRGRFVQIYREAYIGLEPYAYSDPSDIKGYINWLYRTDPEGFIIAIGEDGAVGFVACCRNWWDKELGAIGEIHEIAVLPQQQGKGIGSALLREALLFLGEVHEVFGLWVGEGNEKAKAFYLKHGFEPIGRMGKWIRMISKKRP